MPCSGTKAFDSTTQTHGEARGGGGGGTIPGSKEGESGEGRPSVVRHRFHRPLGFQAMPFWISCQQLSPVHPL